MGSSLALLGVPMLMSVICADKAQKNALAFAVKLVETLDQLKLGYRFISSLNLYDNKSDFLMEGLSVYLEILSVKMTWWSSGLI